MHRRNFLDQIGRLSRLAEQVVVRQSSIVGAGSGVFTVQRVDRDCVLSLYPGFYYALPPVTSFVDGSPPFQVSDLNRERLANSRYIMSCDGGGFIDAAKEPRDISLKCGHIVNHSAQRWNSTAVTFLWSELLKHHPRASQLLPGINRVDEGAIWFMSDEEQPVYYNSSLVTLKGIAIVAARPLDKDEEVLIDYKFNARESTGIPWYTN